MTESMTVSNKRLDERFENFTRQVYLRDEQTAAVLAALEERLRPTSVPSVVKAPIERAVDGVPSPKLSSPPVVLRNSGIHNGATIQYTDVELLQVPMVAGSVAAQQPTPEPDQVPRVAGQEQTNPLDVFVTIPGG